MQQARKLTESLAEKFFTKSQIENLAGNTAENCKPVIAILDWGIGGMEFFRIFKERNPDVGVCYFSDSGSIPYGKQNKAKLLQRLCIIVDFLSSKGITHLVVACNAMSTVLPYWSLDKSSMEFKITGVIVPTISTVLVSEDVKIGVVGGRRTILSGAYSRPLRKSSKTVTQRVAQPLSALIEKGEKDAPIFLSNLKEIMSPLKNVDILILACTHYPAAQDAFQSYAKNARIINPALETFQWVSSTWRLSKDYQPDIFYTTGDPVEMRTSSLNTFGVRIGDIRKVTV